MTMRTESMTISQFLHRNDNKKSMKDKMIEIGERFKDHGVRATVSTSVPLLLLSKYVATSYAHPQAVTTAAIPDAVKSKIVHAFDPLIELVTALSYPIAGVMIAGGCLFIMVGNREKGMSMIQTAAIGYILVQLSPLFLDLLVGIGEMV
jgi:hypothetical protein